MRRTRSRQVGRSVVSGATTPNRNGLVPRVAVVSGIVPVLSFDPGLLPGSCAIYERVRRFDSTGRRGSGGGAVRAGGFGGWGVAHRIRRTLSGGAAGSSSAASRGRGVVR